MTRRLVRPLTGKQHLRPHDRPFYVPGRGDGQTGKLPTQDNLAMALLILILLAFLTVTLVFFGSGWLAVNVP